MCSGVRRSFLACMLTCFQRSLGQGNIFTSVCHSVHRGVGFPACITGHMTRRSLHLGRSASGEICIQGGVCIQGRDLHPGRGLHTRGWSTSRRREEVCIQGGVCIRGLGRHPLPPSDSTGYSQQGGGTILLECILVCNYYCTMNSGQCFGQLRPQGSHPIPHVGLE